MHLRNHILPVLFLSLATLFLSLPALNYGYLLEDYQYLRAYSWSEIARTFRAHWEPTLEETKGYRPLHSVHYAFFHRLLGGDPIRNHILQTVLLTSGTLLLYACALCCTGDIRSAFWSALVYPCLGTMAWHASQLTNRQHLLQLNLVLLSLLCFDRHLRYRRNRSWLGAFGFFLLALLLKEEVVTFPLVLAAYALLVRGEKIRSLFRPLLPFFLAAAVIVLIRAAVVRTLPDSNTFPPPVSLAPELLLREYGRSVLSTLVQTYGANDPDNRDFPAYASGLSTPSDYLGFFSLLGLLIFGASGLFRWGTPRQEKSFWFGLSILLIGSVMAAAWYRTQRLYLSSIGVALMVGILAGGAVAYLRQAEGGKHRTVNGIIVLVFFLIYLGLNLASFYDLQETLRPDGYLALTWDRWVYEAYLPWMKAEQIEIFRAKLRASGREAWAERISSSRRAGEGLPFRETAAEPDGQK